MGTLSLTDSCSNKRGTETPQKAKFMGPTWGPHGICRPQMDPMLAPWTCYHGRCNISKHIGAFLNSRWVLSPKSRDGNLVDLFSVMLSSEQQEHQINILIMDHAWVSLSNNVCVWFDAYDRCLQQKSAFHLLLPWPWEQIALKVIVAHVSSNPFYSHDLTLISAWITNHTHMKVWNEITYPFPNFNGGTVEVWEWISNYIPRVIMDVITKAKYKYIPEIKVRFNKHKINKLITCGILKLFQFRDNLYKHWQLINPEPQEYRDKLNLKVDK